VIRDMYERAMNFSEYVQFYGLARSEGILLRYLTDGYKALRQTVPTEALREDLEDIIAWLGELVRQVDSSLLDEWEELAAGVSAADLAAEHTHESVLTEAPPKLTDNVRAFRVMVRNELFRRVELFEAENEAALGELDADAGWDADRWADAMDAYFDAHDDLGVGPDARGPQYLAIETGPTEWKVRQIFDDPAGDHDWGISAVVDLAASDELGSAVVRITAVGQL